MKKRILSFLLALSLMVPVLYAKAGAAFPDIADPRTAVEAEVLRLMGVMGGYEDGTFHPDAVLNRAQFCKMLVVAIGAEKDLARYSAVTVFPDVKPDHWAASYINLASMGKGIIRGYADGLFHPERPVTLSHACVILLRLLEYSDEAIGGLWLTSYTTAAEEAGLLEGLTALNGGDTLTRALTAKLFVNLLRAKTSGGESYYYLSDETTLLSLDGGAGKMVISWGSYDMYKPTASTTLTGSRGRMVMRDNKALTFLPNEADTAATVSTGAVIVTGNGSTDGFSALTGDRRNYVIYKNGQPATARDLRFGDVATYSPSTSSILVCDTRVSAYYETCSPSPSAPATIELLGGTTFTVLPTAVDSLSRFRPGKVLTFLFTADGQIAGAVDDSSSLSGNAIAIISDGAKLVCGAAEIPLKASASGGPAAYVSSDADGVRFGALRNSVSGALDTQSRTLGNTKLADNARIFHDGSPVALEELDRRTIPAGEISGSHINWAGEVDFVVIGTGTGGYYYGRAVVDRNAANIRERKLAVDCGSWTLGPLSNPIGDVADGEYIAVQVNSAWDRFTRVRTLQNLGTVSQSSWIGKTAVTYGGRTYTVPSGVLCYNRDNGRWITLDEAFDYSERATLYVFDGMVRIVEVRS